MKVLHLGKYYHPVPGGIETQLRMLVIGLGGRGVSQKVVVANTRRQRETDIVDGVEVVRLPSLGVLSSTPLSFGWRAVIREGAYDIIHLHTPNPTATLSLGLTGTASKVVVSYHADVVRQRVMKHFYDPVFRRVLDRADTIVVASPDIESYDAILHPFAKKCVPIGYGIDVARFNDTPGVRAGVERIRNGRPGPIVLFVGRLVYYKGIQVLLEAMRDIDGHLIIAGTGPEEGPMRRMARHLGIGRRVSFVGFVPEEDLPSYYHACDICCLPSVAKSEAFGIVQLEAMACGKPVVSTELGTATSIVNRHGETGLVVSPRNADELADAINRIINDRALRDRLGENGRKRVTTEYGHTAIAERYHELYKSCL